MAENTWLPEIETARLILRTYLPEDADALFTIWSDPDLASYFPATYRERDETQRLEFVAKTHYLWRTRLFSQWGITSKSDGKLIGYCGLQQLGGTADVELYYGLTRDLWGRGLATEAARAATRYGFETLNLPRMTALTFPQNFVSQKVLQKLGFEPGGLKTFYEVEVMYFEILRQKYELTKDESFYHLRSSVS